MPKYTISEFQNEIAARLGVDISKDSFDVAAARILDRVALAVRQLPQRQASMAQKEFAKSLRLSVAKDSMRVASAKISDALHAKNIKALKRLNLRKDDKVVYTEKYETPQGAQVHTTEHVVSSIGANGRVYFKGIGCPGAWPSQLKRAKANNSSKPTPLRGAA